MQPAQATITYVFDPAGNLASKTYANGVTTSFAFDAGNRLTAQQAVKDGQTLQSFSQSLDAADNITQLTENGSLTATYNYDPLNRFTAENIGGYGSLAYTHDKVGNRLTLTEPKPTGGPSLALLQTKVYWASWDDYQNRQLSIDYKITNSGPGAATQTRVTGATATKGVYPTTSMPLGLGDINQGTSAPFTIKYHVPVGVSSDTIGYIYSGLDKLTQVQTLSSTVSYGYDALGRRIQRTEGADTRNIHYSRKSDLPDYWSDGSGNLTAAMIRGADGLISKTGYTGGQPVISYNLYNPHGDTSALTDQSGAVTGTYRYDSFGNAIAGAGLNYGYTGKYERYTDGATGTIEMGVREYDPSLGRFISADPLKGTVTDPQQRNRYPYGLMCSPPTLVSLLMPGSDKICTWPSLFP